MGSRLLGVGLGLLLVTAGCMSAPLQTASTTPAQTATTASQTTTPSQPTGTPPGTGKGTSILTVRDVTFGNDLEHQPRDGFGGSPPSVEVTGSTVLVSGSIFGVGDPACIDITGESVRDSTGPPTVVIRSQISHPPDTACNMTARHWPYRAEISVDGPRPETITVRQVNSDEQLGSWTIALDRAE